MDHILSEGPSSLRDEELLQLVLGARDQLLAPRLLSRGLSPLARATPGQLLLGGLGARDAMKILACIELGRRVAWTPMEKRSRLTCVAELAAVLWGKLAFLPHEEFWTVLLNARLQLIMPVRIAHGGITQCSITAGEAFVPALLARAPAVAFVHNHPSGDPTPSSEDHRLQLLLQEAGHTLGVRVVDQLVLAQSGVHSAVEGRCPPVSLVPREGVG